jgi:hypothetical protein
MPGKYWLVHVQIYASDAELRISVGKTPAKENPARHAGAERGSGPVGLVGE